MRISRTKLANVITSSRFLFAVVLAILFSFDSSIARVLLIVTVMLIIISDRIDGVVARHLGSASTTGSVLDSMADNFVIITGSICLFSKGLIPLWLVLFGLWVRSVMTLVRLLTAVNDKPYAGSRLSTRVKGAAYGFGLLYFVCVYSLSDLYKLPDQSTLSQIAIGIMAILTAVAITDFAVANRCTLIFLFMDEGDSYSMENTSASQ